MSEQNNFDDFVEIINNKNITAFISECIKDHKGNEYLVCVETMMSILKEYHEWSHNINQISNQHELE